MVNVVDVCAVLQQQFDRERVPAGPADDLQRRAAVAPLEVDWEPREEVLHQREVAPARRPAQGGLAFPGGFGVQVHRRGEEAGEDAAGEQQVRCRGGIEVGGDLVEQLVRDGEKARHRCWLLVVYG